MKGIYIEINYKVESLNSFKIYTLNNPIIIIIFNRYTYIIYFFFFNNCNTSKQSEI